MKVTFKNKVICVDKKTENENKETLTKEEMKTLKQQLEEAKTKTTDYVKKNPFKVAGITALAGAVAGGVAGFLLGRNVKKK